MVRDRPRNRPEAGPPGPSSFGPLPAWEDSSGTPGKERRRLPCFPDFRSFSTVRSRTPPFPTSGTRLRSGPNSRKRGVEQGE